MVVQSPDTAGQPAPKALKQAKIVWTLNEEILIYPSKGIGVLASMENTAENKYK